MRVYYLIEFDLAFCLHEFDKKYLYRGLTVVSNILNLRFDFIGYFGPFNDDATGNSDEDPASEAVSECRHFTVEMNRAFLEFDTVSFTFLKYKAQLFFHCPHISLVL